MKILIIENLNPTQVSLGAELSQLGYLVDVVDDGKRAVIQAREQDYDVIILDLMLPRESSLLVLHEIREFDPDVDILIISARDQIHDRITALIQGANDYLVKPFSLVDLHARIQRLARRDSNSPSTAPAKFCPDRPERQLDRVLGKLLLKCQGEDRDGGLIISEVKLADLLQRVCARLSVEAERKNVSIRLPQERLPTLLVDAKWIEHLVAKLLRNAIAESPSGSEVRIRIQPDPDYCALEIENSMREPISGSELEQMLKKFSANGPARKSRGPGINGLTLARSRVDGLNLRLQTSIAGENKLRIRVSNIKTT